MRNLFVTSVVIAFAAMQAPAAAADLVATVDLKFIRSTEQTASVLCFGEKESDCVVWATLNVYKARIRKVLVGTEQRKTFFVLFGKHALREIDFRNVTVIMNRLEAKAETDPQYQIRDWTDKREFFCFPRFPNDAEGFELKKEGEPSLTCYGTK